MTEAERRAERRQVDWGSVVKQAPLAFFLLGVFVTLVNMWTSVERLSATFTPEVVSSIRYAISRMTPEAVAKWERSQAETAGKAAQTEDLNNRRWCQQKVVFKGGDIHEMMRCLD